MQDCLSKIGLLLEELSERYLLSLGRCALHLLQEQEIVPIEGKDHLSALRLGGQVVDVLNYFGCILATRDLQ